MTGHKGTTSRAVKLRCPRVLQTCAICTLTILDQATTVVVPVEQLPWAGYNYSHNERNQSILCTNRTFPKLIPRLKSSSTQLAINFIEGTSCAQILKEKINSKIISTRKKFHQQLLLQSDSKSDDEGSVFEPENNDFVEQSYEEDQNV